MGRYSKSFKHLKNPNLWAIILIFVLCVVFHYPQQIFGSEKRSSVLGLERHAFDRILFVVPIAYASYAFGLSGGITALVLSLCAMIPRIVLISPYPKDALFETVVTIAIGMLLNGWLEYRRREIGRREQTILKLEAVRKELQSIGRQFQEIFEKANDAIWIHDLQGKIIIANDSCAELTGFKREQMTNLDIFQLFSQKYLYQLKEVENALLEGREVKQPFPQRIIKQDGTEAIVMLTTGLLGDEKTPAFLHIARDITEEQRLQENLRLYTNQIGKAHEEERMRIARELHDDTIQTMVVVSRRLDNFIAQLVDLKKEAMEPLELIRKEIDGSLLRLRRFVQHLRPPILEFLGLIPALRELADQLMAQSEIEVKLKTEGFKKTLASEKQLMLYRIVQEALRNVSKHSKASRVCIILGSDSKGIHVSIHDNGRGFTSQNDSELLSTGKLGLLGMKERANLLGGDLGISTRTRKGTTITLDIPDKGALLGL